MGSPARHRLPPGERIKLVGIASWSIIGMLILAGMAIWLLLRIRIIFPPLVLALLIIYLLNPVVTRLEERRVPRSVGAVLTYVVVLGGVVLAGVAVAPMVSAQVSDFGERWPQFRDKLVEYSNDAAASAKDRFGIDVDTSQVACLLGQEEGAGGGSDTPGGGSDTPSAAECDEVIREAREKIAAEAGRITDITQTVLEGLLVFIIAPLIALYLLIDLPQLQHDVINALPERHRAEAADLGTKITAAMGGFFRGQLLVAFIVGALSTIGFALIGLPFAMLIGAIAGFFNLIPLVGPFVGGALGFLIGTVSDGIGLGVQAAVVELVVQQLDNHLISPMVMRRTVQLHPATVMLALLAGGAVAGFWGVLLAVPAVAVAKLLFGHFWITRVLGVDVTPYVRRRGRADEPEGAATTAEAEPT